MLPQNFAKYNLFQILFRILQYCAGHTAAFRRLQFISNIGMHYTDLLKSISQYTNYLSKSAA